MNRSFTRLIALMLTLVMLVCTFTGCNGRGAMFLRSCFAAQFIPVDFADMEYTRPDPEELEEALELCMEMAEEDDFYDLEAALYEFTILYNDFCTNYFLANIHYSSDLTDTYWTEEYNFCMDASSEVEAGLDQLFYALADSEHREILETEDYYGEGFFDDYEGESLWDDHFTQLMDKESELVAQYYDLIGQANEASQTEYYETLAPQMGQLYVDLVLLRMEIAEYAGYDSYPEFAYDFSYTRDYTPKQESAYLLQVQKHLVPIYKQLYTEGISGIRFQTRREEETFSFVEDMAGNMGGTIEEAFELMADYHLYDIAPGENKFNASFAVYLPSYGEPFIFLNPDESDYDFLTFAHEFGHFCNNYASDGSGVSIDVAEIFSQGMEYLSLFYGEDTDMLRKVKMVDSLCTYVEQSAYADFEQRVYAMDPEEVTVDNLFALFEEVGEDYGFDAWGVDGRDFVGVPHFFTSPCYVFSYVVSNDAAFQFYQLEEEKDGAGLKLMEKHLDTEEACFLAFLEDAGLESPFDSGRLESVADTFRDILGYT